VQNIENHAYFQNYNADYNQILQNDKDHQLRFVGDPRWWTAAM